MDCQKLHQEIVELESKYGNVGLQYEKAEGSGRGKGLKEALLDFDKAADELLEKYLPDFQEQFGDKLGIGEARIEGEVKGVGDKIFSTTWGDKFAIINSPVVGGLFSVIDNGDGILSRGERIVDQVYTLGVFPTANEGALLPTPDDGIDIVRKKDDEYILYKTIDTQKLGEIEKVIAMSDRRWVINAQNGVYILNEDLNGELVFSGRVDLADFYLLRPHDLIISPLSDKEMLISSYYNGTGVFAENSPGVFDRVTQLLNGRSNYAFDAISITDDRWLVRRTFGDDACFLFRDNGGYGLREIGVDVKNIFCLSKNELLVESNDGDISVYTVRPDGGLERKDSIVYKVGSSFEGDIEEILPLSDNVWLLRCSEENFIFQRRTDGKYGLGERIGGLGYGVKNAIPLAGKKYLLSDGYVGKQKNAVVRINHDPTILSFHYTFESVDDLKNRLDMIIKAEG